MPLISVIVPIYNVEPYIRRCIDSILSQTFTDFELILVDDGSPDNCPVICDEYALKDSRIHAIHQKNGGLSAARNTGLDYAFASSDSEWVTFIDSDDWVDVCYLEYLYKAVNDNAVNISSCSYNTISENIISEEYCNQNDGLINYKCVSLSPEDYYIVNRVNAIIAWGKLYNKQLFHSIRYPVGRINEDEFVTYRLLFSETKIAVVKSQLYMYYQNPDGIMKSEWTLKRLDVLDALKEQAEYFRDNHFFSAYDHCLKWYAIALTINIGKLQDKNETKGIKQKLIKQLRLVLIKKGYVLQGDEHRLWCYDTAFPRLINIYWIIRNKIKKIFQI